MGEIVIKNIEFNKISFTNNFRYEFTLVIEKLKKYNFSR